MPIVRKLVCYTLALHICVLLMIQFSNFRFRKLNVNYEPSNSFLSADDEPITPLEYKFDDPNIAFKILSQLDVYEPVSNSYYTNYDGALVRYKMPFLGTADNDYYCDTHRAYFVNFPQIVFEDVNLFVEVGPTTFFRRVVVPQIGIDIQPDVGHHMNKTLQSKRTVELKPEITIFATSLAINEFKQVGQHFSCLSQMSNHIPGHLGLNRKDSVANAASLYAKSYKDRPQCFTNDKYFPETWILSDKKECEAFFEAFNSPDYQRLKEERRIVYIRKFGVGKHRGEGVQTVNDQEEADLRKMYENGTKCGAVRINYIIQKYVHNPLLLNGNKFDFRMYMLFASSNPVMTYYHDGFLRVSLTAYDVTSDEKNVHLTNLALTKSMYKKTVGSDAPDMDEDALRHAQQWTMERLQDYLLENGLIKDPNWLDNYLRPEFKRAMIHLSKMSSPSFWRGSSVFELYGVDYMLDDNLNLWFIEANSGPAFGEYTPEVKKVVLGMLTDHFHLVVGLLRSRMKRVINYVNILAKSDDIIIQDDGEVLIPNLNERIKEFKSLSENYFEDEFAPAPENGFVKIVDEHYEGVERYMGLIDEACL